MYKSRSVLKFSACIFSICLLFPMLCLSGFAISIADITVSQSGASSAGSLSSASITANAILYHKYFDLDNTQKDELSQNGYTDAQISKIDKDGFDKLESTFKLPVDEIKWENENNTNLKNTDLSSWSYADLDAYYAKQDAITYAPTADQALQLQKRGVSLALARQMLKEYCTYGNLLAQSDSALSSMTALYSQANQQYADFVKQKEAVRAQYFINVTTPLFLR